jgi:hypothetical protein
MRNLAPALAAALGLLWASPAFAQTSPEVEGRNSPAGLRCSSLTDLEEAEQGAAIQFLAGYSNGERDAMTFATVGTDQLGEDALAEGGETAATAEGEEQTTEPAEAQNQAQAEPGEDQEAEAPEVTGSVGTGSTGGPPIAILPTVPVEAIAAACAQSPDSRIIDIIVAQGALDTQ